jgi:hypothetical protein
MCDAVAERFSTFQVIVPAFERFIIPAKGTKACDVNERANGNVIKKIRYGNFALKTPV